MRGRARGRQAAASTVTIPVQATAVGAVSANQFTGWTHSAGTIFSRTAFGLTTKYFRTSVQSTVDMQSTAISRDQEVTFWASTGRVYLRVVDNKAIRFEANQDGSWDAVFVLVGSTGYESDISITILGSGSAPSGFNIADTDGDEWVVGCSGVEVYVKWNGTEQWRGKQIFHHRPGRVGLRFSTDSGQEGFRHLSALFMQSAAIYSSLEFDIFDVRDFGLKQLSAVGSMTAASTTLTLTSNPGFAIGDEIVVEIGGESGAGALGTIGVGGQWPTLTYANATARAADTGQATGKQAGQLDTGNVYTWTGAAWTQNSGNDAGYSKKILPKALLATITNVSGVTLTLDTAATVSTTSANVYFNVANKYNESLNPVYNVVTSGYNPYDYITGKSVYFETGNWWFAGDNADIQFLRSRSGWTLYGAGRDNTVLNNPKGATTLVLSITSSHNGGVRDLAVRSNRRFDGFLPRYNETTGAQYQDWSPKLLVSITDNFAVLRTGYTNLCPVFSYCTNAYFDDTALVEEEGMLSYIGWSQGIANCTDCYALNTTQTSPVLVTGVEIFQGTGNYFDGVTSTNAQIAVNSSNDWRYSNFVMTFEEDCAADSRLDWMLTGSPLINLNSNIDNQQGNGTNSQPGLFEDFTITIDGAIRVSTNYHMQVFNLNGSISDITIRGHYPTKPNTLGLIDLPADYDTYVINDTQPRVGGGSGKLRTVVQGIRVKGGEVSPSPVYVQVDDTTSSVIDCVLDSYTTGGTDTGNITNAAYEALP